MSNYKKIDIGCGRYKVEGRLGVALMEHENVDIILDLNIFPNPFKENEIDEIHSYHFLEHIDDFIGAMHEFYRISKHGAKIYVRCPHVSCCSTAWADPTHKRAFVKNSFLHFSGDSNHIYGFKTNIEVVKVRLHYFLYEGKRNGIKLQKMPIVINTIINKIVNFSPTMQDVFERIFVYWIGGFEEVYYELKVIKE
jgi:hypothetical protein